MLHEFTEEQKMIRTMTSKFAKEKVAPRAAEVEKTDEFPRDLFMLTGEMGLIGLFYPKDCGGVEADFVTCCMVVEELAKGWASFATIWGSMAGMLSSIFALGATPEQRMRFAPEILKGEKISGFGLTEPEAGSDVLAMRSTAVLDGDEYIINGVKNFNTCVDDADMTLIFVKTDPTKGPKGIAAFIVEKGTPGFSFNRFGQMMGFRGFHHCESIFENCRVPRDNLVAKEGEAFKVVVNTLDEGRVMAGAAAVGLAEAALNYAIDYAKNRVQFGKPISEFQAIRFMLADMATMIEAARGLTYRAAAVARNFDTESMKLTSMAKCFASDMALEVASKAIDIYGGYGYSEEFPVERLMRDAKGIQILEGTNQIQRIAVAGALLR